MTKCWGFNSSKMEFSLPISKKVDADFDGGDLTSDGGSLLLGEADRLMGLTERTAACIRDVREEGKVWHQVTDLLRQRIFQIACGYEDCNDADSLRKDPALKLLAGRCPDSGRDLASQPTLSRFENSVSWGDLYRLSEVLIDVFIDNHRAEPPEMIILDFDATEDLTHGQQTLSFFHGFYDSYCYLPLLCFAKCNGSSQKELLAAVLRPGNVHSGNKTLAILRRIVERLRRAFPDVKIIFRADCGFALPEIYDWCEDNGVRYLIGLPKNDRLLEKSRLYRIGALTQYALTRIKVRNFGEIKYAAGSWRQKRRVIIKAEVMSKGENPRFVVTNLSGKDTKKLYDLYVRRGNAENRIKELKLDLKADRTSCHRFEANQFRLLLHGAAYVLFQSIQRFLKNTELEKAQVSTIREKLIKIGARVRETVRRVRIHFSTSFPLKQLFETVLTRFQLTPAIT